MSKNKKEETTESLDGASEQSREKARVLSKGYEVLSLTDENILTSCNNCRSQRMITPT